MESPDHAGSCQDRPSPAGGPPTRRATWGGASQAQPRALQSLKPKPSESVQVLGGGKAMCPGTTPRLEDGMGGSATPMGRRARCPPQSSTSGPPTGPASSAPGQPRGRSDTTRVVEAVSSSVAVTLYEQVDTRAMGRPYGQQRDGGADELEAPERGRHQLRRIGEARHGSPGEVLDYYSKDLDLGPALIQPGDQRHCAGVPFEGLQLPGAARLRDGLQREPLLHRRHGQRAHVL